MTYIIDRQIKSSVIHNAKLFAYLKLTVEQLHKRYLHTWRIKFIYDVRYFTLEVDTIVFSIVDKVMTYYCVT